MYDRGINMETFPVYCTAAILSSDIFRAHGYIPASLCRDHPLLCTGKPQKAMRRTLRFFSPLIFLIIFSPTATGEPAAAPTDALRVMSFNLRYNNPGDGDDAWPHRKEIVASMIRFHQADLIGVQEALVGMLDELEMLLPGYARLGVGRADGKDGGEFSAILYRKDRFEVIRQATFWLSDTPDVVASVGWDASMERIATWGLFRDRETGRSFYLFNTHFDHKGEEARRESARLLLRQIDALAGDAPVLVTGDFNTPPDSEPYRVLTTGDGAPKKALHDAMTVSRHGHHGPTATWNGFEAIEPGRRIDFIFVRGPVEVLQHGILGETWDGRFPSDHLPVLAEVQIEK